MFLIVFGLIAVLSVPASADWGGYGGSAGEGVSAGLSGITTRAVTRTLKRDMASCRKLSAVYRYDCYRKTYTLASRQLNGQPAYREAQAALDGVVAALDRIVERNADPSAPQAPRNLQTLTPIKPAALAQAKREFTQALDEAETVLLRSAEQGNVHFARIAEAVHSNKVLLRSLLLWPGGPARTAVRFA
ncbi:MAG: hypothetical protein ACK5MY_07280 [Jhaorihella sp.]